MNKYHSKTRKNKSIPKNADTPRKVLRQYRGSRRSFSDRLMINSKTLISLRFFCARELSRLARENGVEAVLKGIKVIPLVKAFFSQNEKSITERQARNYAKELSRRNTSIEVFRNKSKRDGWQIRMLFNENWIRKIEKQRDLDAKQKRIEEADRRRMEEQIKQRKRHEKEVEEAKKEVLEATGIARWEDIEKLRERFCKHYEVGVFAQLELIFPEFKNMSENSLSYKFWQFINVLKQEGKRSLEENRRAEKSRRPALDR